MQINTKALHNGVLRSVNRPTKITYEFLTQEGKTLHENQNHLILYYPKDSLPLSQIHSYNEQNPETFHDSDTRDMTENDLFNSSANYEFDDNVFDDDSFCNIDDDNI